MSETAHIRNLLRKNSKMKNATSSISVTQYRYGVKGASIQVVDSFLELFEEAYSEKSDKITEVWAKYSTYADDPERSFTSSTLTIDKEEQPIFQGDFFDNFPDVLINLNVTNQHEKGEKLLMDAVYSHDQDDREDPGEIDVEIYLPKNVDPSACVDMLNQHRLEICGLLSHEFQHVVQKHIYGEILTGTAGTDVTLHAFDRNEIDARVEEILTLMGEYAEDEDEETFIKQLDSYLDGYLNRNFSSQKSTLEIQEIKNKMLSEHISAYKTKVDHYGR